MEEKGLDVSAYQGNIDWSAVVGAGYRYAVLRSITKNGIDKWFERYYAGAVQAGLSVGVYAFSYAVSLEEIQKEAQRVLALLAGRRLALPVFLDMEWPEQKALGRTAVTALAKAFLQYIRTHSSYEAGIYCNMDWYKTALEPSQLSCDFWIAGYGANNGNPGKKPEIPSLAAWQYTSQGIVPGIEGNVDLNLFYKKYPSQQADTLSGWQQTDGEWRFFLGNTGQPVQNDWYEYQGKWYWFNGAGIMEHDSWYFDQGYWYYLGSDGAMATGLLQIKEKWYYLDENGRMATKPVTFIPGEDGALAFPPSV